MGSVRGGQGESACPAIPSARPGPGGQRKPGCGPVVRPHSLPDRYIFARKTCPGLKRAEYSSGDLNAPTSDPWRTPMPAHPRNITPPPDLPNGGSKLVPPRGAEPESEIIGPVAGRYDLGEQIARGGMGIVYRAHDRHLNRTVALKIIRTRFLERP